MRNAMLKVTVLAALRPCMRTSLALAGEGHGEEQACDEPGPLPEESGFRSRPCACGCEQTSDRDFAPGHEFRAIQARIRDHFSGSPLALIQWIDKNHPQPAS
jgi:hypothetical protein